MTQNIELINQLVENSDITAYINMIKLYDEDTYNHCVEVGTLTYLFLNELKKQGQDIVPEKDFNEVIKGALIHDIGKINLPFGLIRSTHRLDNYELDIIKEHPLIGYVFVKDTDLSDIIKKIILKHHCTLDNSSYPITEKIENSESYIWIVAICDKIDAMTSYRPFKESLSYEKAFAELAKLSKKEIIPYKYMSALKEVIRKEGI